MKQFEKSRDNRKGSSQSRDSDCCRSGKKNKSGEDIPLHTAQGWKLRGDYMVKDNAAPIKVKLWKRQEDGRFYLARSYLYSADQMRKVK